MYGAAFAFIASHFKFIQDQKMKDLSQHFKTSATGAHFHITDAGRHLVNVHSGSVEVAATQCLRAQDLRETATIFNTIADDLDKREEQRVKDEVEKIRVAAEHLEEGDVEPGIYVAFLADEPRMVVKERSYIEGKDRCLFISEEGFVEAHCAWAHRLDVARTMYRKIAE